jgi:hypothetical protein
MKNFNGRQPLQIQVATYNGAIPKKAFLAAFLSG